MMRIRKYILDADIFIDAKNRYYAFDICPGFWNSLANFWKSGELSSIDHVERELLAGNDDLTNWVTSTSPAGFFESTQENSVVNSYQQIIQWSQSCSQFTDAAKSEFAAAADGWLVAYAKTNGMTVVTRETFSPYAKNRIKIPNICKEFQVNYVDTFEMLRALGIKFTL